MGERTLIHANELERAEFFPDAKLNVAENLLRTQDNSDALVFWGENRVKKKFLTANCTIRSPASFKL